ncbi:MAG TPA: hypothetical protein VD860_04235 [Azospirillum sp.]|nr:hypothetical protein [Azospirillum sp.]
MMRGTGIVPRERFRKTGGARTVCVVAAFDERHGLPPHACLVPEGEPGAPPPLLIGVAALRDPRLWTCL